MRTTQVPATYDVGLNGFCDCGDSLESIQCQIVRLVQLVRRDSNTRSKRRLAGDQRDKHFEFLGNGT